ncbi:MAG: hypothetical protein C4617_04490 [Candidatus Liberibacter europaeus]|uniref:HTH cro/C1-type domain-containing protein n=1 Tax=Candidatus Liberibacter europaeus TaxID=744859 RepID=A0A2T4VWX0_9HYPH|nr:hypothetical protein [Candidatus Liberibacter europaeus]PTL86268.1 MAG: hypothetical protein C4617_04490 [Candidatus Liberibacter europaeus]
MKKKAEHILDWQEIGQRFKSLRLECNYTQAQMSEISNQVQQSIAMFESGTAPASINYALFLRNEFGVPFEWLYCGINVKVTNTDRNTERTLEAYTIGARLNSIRKKEGMTLKAFSDWIGIPLTTLSNYEKGRNVPEVKTALLIKDALNKPLDWIYFGDTCIPTKGGTNRHITPPSIPLKQVKKTLKDEVMHHIKTLDANELALFVTRMRMEKEALNNAELRHNTTQHNTTRVSPESKPKSSE